jgi:hypothetical protein
VSRVVRRCATLAVRSPATTGMTIMRAPVCRTAALASPQTAFCGRHGVFSKALGSVRFRSSDAGERDSTLGPMNDDIRARFVSVVGSDGAVRRGVPIAQAIQEAQSAGLDLVQVAQTDGQVVCRVFNAQKRLFELKKSLKHSKPKQDKEVKLSVKTEVLLRHSSSWKFYLSFLRTWSVCRPTTSRPRPRRRASSSRVATKSR